jgi:hypothetical protein
MSGVEVIECYLAIIVILLGVIIKIISNKKELIPERAL